MINFILRPEIAFMLGVAVGMVGITALLKIGTRIDRKRSL